MEEKHPAFRPLLFGLIGALFALLSTSNPVLQLLVVTVSSGFLLAAGLERDWIIWLGALLSGVFAWLFTASLPVSLLTALMVLSLVLGLRSAIRKELPLASCVGSGALIAAVVLFVFLMIWVYASKGALDFTEFFAGLHGIKESTDESLYQELLPALRQTELAAAEIDQIISDLLTAKNRLIDLFINSLPGLALGGLFLSAYLAQLIAKLLTKKEAAISTEPLWRIRLPRALGILFLLALVISFFADGILLKVLDNLVTAFEVAFLLTGAFTVYAFFSRKATTRSSKAITVILVVITVIGFPVNLSGLYAVLGAGDAIWNFRGKIAARKNGSEQGGEEE